METGQLEMVRQYVELLHTIQEGFDYVTDSFADYQKTESDLVLGDIFSALAQVEKTNLLMKELFPENAQFAVDQFECVAEQALKLDGHLKDSNWKERVITQFLSPAYSAWYTNVIQFLHPYIKH